MESTENTIDTIAADWVVRRDAGLVPEQQREFEAWAAADPRHRGAYIRAQAAWHEMDRVASLAAGDASRRSRYALLATRYRLNWAAGMLLCIAGAAAAVWLTRFSQGQIFASEVGEIRKIELADGSQLALNTDTRAKVRFDNGRRAIELDRGEALFKVARDASRPFVVRANDVTVTALGTAFVVRIDDTRTDVVVTEGVVEVARAQASGSRSVQRVTAHHRVMLASAASRLDIEPITEEALARELAWREGMVAFSGEPLSVAVAELNRYSRQHIYVDDPALAARPVVGIFNANDAEAFAVAASATFGARIERANGNIHLRVGATHR